jgi:hypothetical protein
MMLVHLNESRLMHGTCWFKLLVQVVWWRLIGIGCYRLLVQVDGDRLTVAMVDSVTVTGCLHLTFIISGWLDGARIGGCSHLPVVVGELREL